MKRVIFNQKGGVGKSSIAVNLAAISAQQGLRTLLLDLDPQCNSSQYLMGDGVNAIDRDAMDFFEHSLSFKMRDQPFDSYAVATPIANLKLVAANPQLGELHAKLEAKHKIYKLKEALDQLQGFDRVFIDTPPAFNFFSLSALVASDRCLIPFDCDEFSRQALYALLDNVEETRADHNPGLAVEGIIINQFQPQARLPQAMVQHLTDAGLPVLKSYLSASVKMKESHNANQPLAFYAPRHKLTQQLLSLFAEIERAH